MANYFLTPRDRLKLSKGKQSADSTAARYQLLDSVTRFLLNTARRKPLIILFDNLHLADRSSLALLEYFCQQIVGHPVLIVGAYRESEHSTISRVVLHRKAGEQLEIRYRQDLLSHVSQLAHHYFEAAQAGKERKAVVYCRQAAEMANAQRAYGEAAALFDCAHVCLHHWPRLTALQPSRNKLSEHFAKASCWHANVKIRKFCSTVSEKATGQ